MVSGKADRMAAHAAMGRRDDRGVVGVERARQCFVGRCRDPRHVAERDEPAGCVRARADARREACAHAAQRVGRIDDLAAGIVQQHRELFRAGTHDRDDVGRRRRKAPRGGHRDRRAVGQRREQLALQTARIETLAETAGEQHAGGE